MSSSPFVIFRRYLKPLMVALTLLALFAFVVLPALQSYLQSGATVGADPVFATFDGTPVKASRVDYFTQSHNSVVRFLNELADETIRRQGTPRTAGFRYNTQTNQVEDLGIFSAPSQFATVRTLQFASEAKKAGFELDDGAIRYWLQQFTDGTMSDGEIISRLMQSTRNRLGQYHLYDVLRQLLLAQAFQQSVDSGLAAGSIPGMGDIPIVTPAQQWENFLKLSQQATVDAYGVLVADFIDKTDPNPSESDINEVYEAGKDLLPNDQSPEPGFRRPTVAEFEFVAANLNTFIDREIDNFTEEQLKAEYQRRLDGGDFRLPVEPEADQDLLDLGMGSEAAADEEAAEEEAAAEEEMAEVAEEAAEEPMTEEPVGDEAPAEETPAEETTVEEQAAEESPTEETSVEESPAEESPAAEEAPAEEDGAATRSPRTGTTLVALVQDESDDAETADDAGDADTAEADATDADADAEDGEGEPEFEAESFEDVRNEILDDLARPIAAQKLDKAVQQVRSRMQRYFSELSIHESNVAVGTATEADAPERPDLKKLADDLGLEYGTIGERNAEEIADEAIGNSVGTGTSLDQRGPPFAFLMFGGGGMQGQAVLSPLVTVDLTASKTYVSWKTDQIDSYAPTLEEARDEVVMAIRTREARKFAEEEATRIAKQVAAENEKSLEEAIPDDKQDQLKTGLGPFSWMNMMGFGQMTIGNVPELDSVGPKFMRATFHTEVGNAGVAANAPQRVYYVIVPRSFQPSVEELRNRFLQRGERMMAQFLTNTENNEIRRGFYEALDERTGFKMTEFDQPE
ncbi:hypothetical protein [Crateriforma conspicua]|uniref:Periplasmic folding chaperone n=1 Tax=Crateriforma conspicua TaxID=2527996 RepID=A0A5C5Y4E2_9PLAN|nr:hypothetical protein [Crateriforma conspicua]TWT68252.1 hypothetical protein Pan14r_04960 [Crateriforma conspicua]